MRTSRSSPWTVIAVAAVAMVATATARAAPTLATLVTFTGTANASRPFAGQTADAPGDLYGTAYAGGANGGGTATGGPYGDGTVFELSPVAVPEPATAGLLGRRRARRA